MEIDVKDVEDFLNRCELLEKTLERVKEILNSPELNGALIEIYTEDSDAALEITKAFVAIKGSLQVV